jgi:hypothetical protein
MADKYFLYSDEQIKEKNQILAHSSKCFVPGVVVVNGKRVKYTQLSDTLTIPRFVDTKVIASGDLASFTYVEPTTSIRKGN